MEFLKNRRSWQSPQTPRQSSEKWTLLSLAFYNAPSLHIVDGIPRCDTLFVLLCACRKTVVNCHNSSCEILSVLACNRTQRREAYPKRPNREKKTISLEIFNLAWKLQSRLKFSISTFGQKNPRAHKNKVGTPPPKNPPLKRGISWTWWFPAERKQKFRVPIKLAHPFPAPESRTRILRTRWLFWFGNPHKKTGPWWVARLNFSISLENFNPGGISWFKFFFNLWAPRVWFAAFGAWAATETCLHRIKPFDRPVANLFEDFGSVCSKG